MKDKESTSGRKEKRTKYRCSMGNTIIAHLQLTYDQHIKLKLTVILLLF